MSEEDGTPEEPEILVESARGVVRLTINRPHHRNALSMSAITALRDSLATIRDNPDDRVVVLAGVDKAFCSGVDLGQLTGRDPSESSAERRELGHVFEDLWSLGKPTIAAVRGWCLAGGMGLALACDLVIAADDATFGTPEINVGLWPYMITVPLVHAMPPKKALELMLTGEPVNAAEGHRIGFVNEVVPVDRFDERVAELAVLLASKSPSAMNLGRSSFYEVWGNATGPALDYLNEMLTRTIGTHDAQEGIAAFRERRAPKWGPPGSD